MLRRSRIGHALPLLVYVGLTIALTWPLAADLTGLLPFDAGDPLLSTWALWWNARVLPFSEAWWNAPMFVPATNTMTLSDHRVGIGVITSPLIWAGASPIAAHNTAFLLTFFLSAAAAYALCLSVTGSRVAGFVGGLAFGFNPFRAEHLPHLELLASYWLPIVLLALHKWVERPSRSWLVVLASALTMQALTSGYYFFFLGVLLGVWLLWFVPRGLTIKQYAELAVALIVPLVVVAPILARYRAAHSAMGLFRSIDEIEQFSADVSGLFTAPQVLTFWNTPAEWQRLEGGLFPGATAVLLVIVVLIVRKRDAGLEMSSLGRMRLAVLTVAAIAFGVALIPAVYGPLAYEIGSVRVSTSGFYKPFSVAFVLASFWVVTSPAFVRAYRGSSPFAFYVAATCLMWLLSFGPTVRVFGERVLYKAPYAWLMVLPGFRDEFRAPARFAMLAALTLSVAAAIAFCRAFGSWSSHSRAVATGIVALGIVLDTWIGRFPVAAAPKPLEIPAGIPADAALLELPMGGVYEDAAAIYRGTVHERPTVNGLSGYDPPHYSLLRYGLQEESEVEALVALAAYRCIAIFVARSKPDLSNAVRTKTPATLIAVTDAHDVLLLPRSEPRNVAKNDRRPLTIRNLTPTANITHAHLMTDGDPLSTWSSDTPQVGSEEVLADLGDVTDVAAVALMLGRSFTAYPRILAIDVSVDATRWAEVWRGRTLAPSVAAAISDPAAVPARFAFAPQPARYVRLRQLGRSTQPWAIGEIRVLGR